MAVKKTNIYNLTDVKARPRAIKMYRNTVVPGGRLVLPEALVTGLIQVKRLSRMVAAKDIHVGPTPPPWYLKLKREQSTRMRRRQSVKLSRSSVAPVVAPVVAEPLFDIDSVMAKLGKKTKGDIVKFAAYVRPAPLMSEQMLKADMLGAVQTALEMGSSLIPLQDALDLLEE